LYQNHLFKTISKSYQNHKNLRKIDQTPVPGLFLFLFFEANSPEPHQNRIEIISKLYENNIKTVPKPYQHHIKTIAKSNQNHKNPREIDQKAVPGLFLLPFLKPTRGEP
jgi:hypothetical protein